MSRSMIPAYPWMFHVEKRVCEGCGVLRSFCGCECLCFLWLGCLLEVCVLVVNVGVSRFGHWVMVVCGLGLIIWVHCLVMRLLAV